MPTSTAPTAKTRIASIDILRGLVFAALSKHDDRRGAGGPGLYRKVANRFTKICTVYGTVPFFYYVIHWYLIDVIHVILFFVLGYTSKQIVNPNSHFVFAPYGWGFGLGGVYLIWLVVVVLLYRPCKWFGHYKRTHRQWWLSYL